MSAIFHRTCVDVSMPAMMATGLTPTTPVRDGGLNGAGGGPRRAVLRGPAC
jgi:hypothetical protein